MAKTTTPLTLKEWDVYLQLSKEGELQEYDLVGEIPVI